MTSPNRSTLRRRPRESWRQAMVRVAAARDLQCQVRATYDALVKRGVSDEEAASSAVIEWECAELNTEED